MPEQTNTPEPQAQKPTYRIGGSLLPSSEPRILQPMPGEHGTFQVHPLPELDTYGLFLTYSAAHAKAPAKPGGLGQLLAMHSNGYSCHNLAERLLAVWQGEREVDYAMAQFDYILACGGMGIARGSADYIARGLPAHD